MLINIFYVKIKTKFKRIIAYAIMKFKLEILYKFWKKSLNFIKNNRFL